MEMAKEGSATLGANTFPKSGALARGAPYGQENLSIDPRSFGSGKIVRTTYVSTYIVRPPLCVSRGEILHFKHQR